MVLPLYFPYIAVTCGEEREETMKKLAMTINLVDDASKIEQYKAYHRSVWPEVEQCLKSVGIVTMDIYLLGRRLFMVVETDDAFDLARDFGRLPDLHPRYKEWQELMETFQERVPEAKDREHWAMMERVYHLGS
jgi:L-rhamnose mutarotase